MTKVLGRGDKQTDKSRNGNFHEFRRGSKDGDGDGREFFDIDTTEVTLKDFENLQRR